MSPYRGVVSWSVVVPAIVLLGFAACAPAARPAAPGAAAPAAPSQPTSGQAAPSDSLTLAMTLSYDELHQRALAEGGTFSYYGTLAQINAEKILPAFEARFPGMKVDHIDATADRLSSRIISEARGGKVIADVLEADLQAALQVERQNLLFPHLPPEAQEYTDDMKGRTWLAVGMTYIIAAWNTNLVRPDEAPRGFEDFADPRWNNRLIAEPRDVELLVLLGRKYGSEERALDMLKRLAANNVEFHKGHSDLAELLVAGQAAACVTCYSHHFPSRMRRGAPVDYLLTEGAGQITATGVLKDAPHPYSATLWHRWIHSVEGQTVWSEGGRTPAHPQVEPRERTRPDTIFAMGPDVMADTSKYDRVWKDVFQLR